MVFRVYGVVCAGFLVLFVLVNLYNRNEGSFSADLNDEIDPTVSAILPLYYHKEGAPNIAYPKQTKPDKSVQARPSPTKPNQTLT